MNPPAALPLPAGLVSLADHEAHARLVLDDNAWAYFSGAAADEHTLRANRGAWDRIELLPRVLRPLVGGHTRVTLLGRTLAHPILLAPVAYQRMAHPDGELATAHAAAALGAGLVLSTQASIRLEDVAQAGRGPLWFQLYLQPDRGVTHELVQRAEQAGYEALVLTIDAPVHGARDRERRAGFRLPPGIQAVSLAGQNAAAPPPLQPGQSALFDGLLAHAPTWDDVAWLQAQTRLPVLLKGVMQEDDARQAASLQLAGVIVSNHGGRTLDTAPASAAVLPRIAETVAGQLPVLVDGAYAAAPTRSRPWRWAPAPFWWAGPQSGAWPTPAPWAWPMCCACCAMNSRSRWRCAAAARWTRLLELYILVLQIRFIRIYNRVQINQPSMAPS